MNEYTFAVEDELLKGRRWEDVVFGLLSTYQSGSIELPSFGKVEVEKRNTERSDINSYGEYEQDSTEEIYVILKIAGKFYKKLGTADSYGRATWDGKFREVVPVTKTVQVYEWE